MKHDDEFWTDKKEEFLVANLNRYTWETLAFHLGAPTGGIVRSKAIRMGLEKDPRVLHELAVTKTRAINEFNEQWAITRRKKYGSFKFDIEKFSELEGCCAKIRQGRERDNRPK